MSRINFGAKPNMYPLPVLIIATYDKDGNPDAMNAAWGVVTDFNEISISMGDHKTTDNLAATGAFTVSMATEDTVVGCDYVGIESGRKVPDKFARAGFHATKSEFVNAPLIDELPMALECKVKSFDNGILVGEIVNVSVDERALDENGKLAVEKLHVITFDYANHWARRSPARSRTAKNSSKSGETESAASHIFFGTRRFFAVSVRISTLFVQNRRISVKISLKTVPFTTGTGAGQMV